MDFGLKGKTALVFGGSKGLGRGSAEALAAEGVDVALIARDPASLEATAAEIARKHGIRAKGLAGDLTDRDAVAHAVDAAEAFLGGKIDILVNNTGGPPPSGVVGLPPSHWQSQFQTMVLSVLTVTDRVLPGMRQRRWGRILTIASSVVVQPNTQLGVSATLRSALVGWSKTLAAEVAADGITVNMLLPGLIATNRTTTLDEEDARHSGKSVAEIEAESFRQIPVGRYGRPEEFGAVAAFLASVPAAYLTGGMIRVDGGLIKSI